MLSTKTVTESLSLDLHDHSDLALLQVINNRTQTKNQVKHAEV